MRGHVLDMPDGNVEYADRVSGGEGDGAHGSTFPAHRLGSSELIRWFSEKVEVAVPGRMHQMAVQYVARQTSEAFVVSGWGVEITTAQVIGGHAGNMPAVMDRRIQQAIDNGRYAARPGMSTSLWVPG